MDFDTYFKLHPEALIPYGDWIRPSEKYQAIRAGVLQFNDDTACCWGGPFPGNVAGFSLYDVRVAYPSYKGKPLAEARATALVQVAKLKESDMRYEHQPYWAELFARVQAGDAAAIHVINEWGTLEHPFTLHVFGNDDCSYSKWFATQAEAEAVLDLLEAGQPLDMFKDFHPFYFVFTN